MTDLYCMIRVNSHTLRVSRLGLQGTNSHTLRVKESRLLKKDIKNTSQS